MAAVYLHVRQRRNQNIRRKRVFRDRDNPLDYLDDENIIRKYRLSRPLILMLCGLFENAIQRQTMRSNALPVFLQIMVALRFYATKSFQMVNADTHRICKSSVSLIIRDVTACLKEICHQYIRMPTDRLEPSTIMQGFHNVANFPNVVGAIDGTPIRIRVPSIDEHLYVNSKSYHSINVQAVCDANMFFLNIVARWPGGTHDAFIWSNSNLNTLFEMGTIPNGWLLGDSGYPLRPWLMTPVLNPTTRKQERYNSSHMRTRSIVERSFGILKSCFRCIDNSGGTLLYHPQKACDIVVAVAVLHNMCVSNNVPIEPREENHRDNGHIGRHQYAGNHNDGSAVRERLINDRF